MARLSRLLSFWLVVILAFSILLVVTPIGAQSIPKPTVPEFTIAYIDKSFTTIDGAYYDSKTIQVTIKNQPSLNNSLFYNVRYRINGGDWRDIYTMDDAYPLQSDSEYTIISVYLHPPSNDTIVPANSVVDIQVEAMIGYIHREYNSSHTSQLDMYPYVFTGETSGWSTAQTLIILPNDGPTSPPKSDYDLTITLASVAVAVLLIIVFSVLLYNRYLKKTNAIKNKF